MANPTVTILPASRAGEYPPTSQRKIVEAQMVCDGVAGDLANFIPASVFGMRFIETCSSAMKSDNTAIALCSPLYDGSGLVGKNVATGALAAIPAGTYLIVLEGY